jgi:8-oxo-dGTP pyrophosphatase MutT (NUDIX family)
MKLEFSAGGIVYKKEADKTFILVAQHSQHHGWVFPKGLIGDHVAKESREETAIREVREETGVYGKILQPLNPVSYRYVFEKEKINKTVYYFLMEVVKEDIKKHDYEMENVEWVEESQVLQKLTYPSDKKVWREVKRLI